MRAFHLSALLLALLFVLSFLAVPPASALAVACAVPAPGWSGAPRPTQFYGVVGNLGVTVASGFCAGTLLVDNGPTCPVPPVSNPVALPGELCGLYIRPGWSITCEWVPGAGSVTNEFYIGLDFFPGPLGDGDTLLIPPGEVVYGPIPPWTVTTITNPTGSMAQWIAYAANGLPIDVNFVNCA